MPTDVPVTSEPDLKAKFPVQPGSLVALALMSLVVGAAAGFLGAVFRLALE